MRKVVSDPGYARAGYARLCDPGYAIVIGKFLENEKRAA
jgi:hypothetical protein